MSKPLSEEHKEKLRVAMRRKWEDKNFRAKQIERMNAAEVRLSRSEGIKQFWADPDNKARMAVIKKAVANRPEVRAKLMRALDKARKAAAERSLTERCKLPRDFTVDHANLYYKLRHKHVPRKEAIDITRRHFLLRAQ